MTWLLLMLWPVPLFVVMAVVKLIRNRTRKCIDTWVSDGDSADIIGDRWGSLD